MPCNAAEWMEASMARAGGEEWRRGWGAFRSIGGGSRLKSLYGELSFLLMKTKGLRMSNPKSKSG